MDDFVSFIPLGGSGDITKNMYLYEYKDQILIVDCGLGFADETMLGVDLFLPDISYLLKTNKKIVGMVLSHGHEDHIGGLPFILPQLPNFPIFASPFTAALANEKLRGFNLPNKVNPIGFEEGEKQIGNFSISLIRVTHSVPDTSHIFIKTPVGNFYHGSDFKFDDTPSDGKKSDYEKIQRLAAGGVDCLMSDCLGMEKKGRSGSEIQLADNFFEEMKNCRGKFIVTTYSSHVARLNQIIEVSRKLGRKICFVGRSLMKTTDVAKKIGYMKLENGEEVLLDEVKRYRDNQLTFIIAGSQGQDESALSRVTNGEQREIKLREEDTVVFSSDPIPGNEVSIYELIDTLFERGAKVLYSPMTRDFHVSGHGSEEELQQLISLTKPKKLIPIGGGRRHMYLYRKMVEKLGYKRHDAFILDDGQEVLLSRSQAKLGRPLQTKNVYVDKISGEEIDSFVLRDRQKLSQSGVVIVLSEIDSSTGKLIGNLEVIVKGVSLPYDSKKLGVKLFHDLNKVLSGRKGRVTNWVHIRNIVSQVSERRIFKDFHVRPLVLPVVIEM